MAYNNNSQGSRDRVRYDIVERIGVLGERNDGWKREVNIVAWNDAQAKVDIRDWAPDHKRMSKGVTLLEDEAENLVRALAARYGLSIGNNTMPSAVFERRDATPGPSPEAGHGSYGEPEQRGESAWAGSNYGAGGSGLYDNEDTEPLRGEEVAEDAQDGDDEYE